MPGTPINSDQVEPLTTAVGSLIISCATAEAILDLWQTVIFQSAGGRKVIKRMGFMYGEKTALLRQCFKDLELLHEFAPSAIELLDELDEVFDTRHIVAHQRPISVNEADGTFTFQKLELVEKRTFHRATTSTLALGKIAGDALKCEHLHAALIRLTQELIERFVPDAELQGLTPK